MSYIICFWDKSKLQVSDETGAKLQAAIISESIKNFKLGANLYAVGGVEKIIDKYTAFDVFPSEYEMLNGLEDLTTNDLPALDSGQTLLTKTV